MHPALTTHDQIQLAAQVGGSLASVKREAKRVLYKHRKWLYVPALLAASAPFVLAADSLITGPQLSDLPGMLAAAHVPTTSRKRSKLRPALMAAADEFNVAMTEEDKEAWLRRRQARADMPRGREQAARRAADMLWTNSL